jgi:protease-4
MNFTDNLAALVYFKGKVHKWKNIALLFGVLSFLLIFKMLFGLDVSNSVIEGSHIASIKIDGVIFNDEYRNKILENLVNDNNVKAVIVNIDSPGGEIVGSEILYNNLREIAKKKPIGVLKYSSAASGAYMASIASDYIVAHNGTLTGSIGVLMESPEFTDLASKIGVKFNTYKSSPLKGSPSPFEKSNQQIERVIKESIDDSYRFFVQLVEERRGKLINRKFQNEVFDGRVFTGRQAVNAGLVDKIGSQNDILEYFKAKKIDVEDLPIREVEIVKKDKKFLENFVGKLPFLNPESKIANQHKIMAILP